ncbi:MAG TPA: CBS domain-containing protein [Sedimentisphaerales bacterium]|jgi:CBS domain-containing protein|nr:CBS domain-containing protein [Sedimentisphaerales bacterium]HNU28679.1 CBS domain-containing protein [Sedimentisphaerales bacterium]
MAATATDILSRIAELSDAAFAAFCDDIGGMFGVEMHSARQKVETSTVRAVRDSFKKLSVVHLTKADGAVNGTFHLVFDHGGLFILSGVIVMLPESRILEEAKRGSIEDATNLQDAAREVGNLLVGSWDRIFREECPGHGHFVKTGTFLGKPWEKPEQIELQSDTQVVVVTYEMGIESYPDFTCAAVFPSAVLEGFGEDKATQAEPAPSQTPAAAPQAAEKPAQTQPAPGPVAPQPSGVFFPQPGAAGPQPAQEPSPAPTPKPAEPAASATPASQTPQATRTPSQDTGNSSSPATAGPGPGPQIASLEPPVPEAAGGFLPPTRRSPLVDAGMLPSELAGAQSRASGAVSPGGFAFLDAAYIQSQPPAPLAEFLATPASEVMEKDVVWAGPEDTVQDVIAKMQQQNVGYVLIGVNGALEGLVSNSNIQSAVSLYLRPMFAKWHRPQDDATLGVKVKWIMSRPVRTVRPDATLASMIETMRRCGGRCLPVVDAKGAVQGIVTVFDILLRVLESDKSISFKGRPPQAPALLI